MKNLFIILTTLIFCFLLSVAIWSAIVWAGCWALTALGIATIGTWTVAFSWKLVLIVALTVTVLKAIFGTSVTINK